MICAALAAVLICAAAVLRLSALPGSAFAAGCLAAAGAIFGLYFGISVLSRKYPRAAKRAFAVLTAVILAGAAVSAAALAFIVTGSRSDDASNADIAVIMGAGVHGEEPSQSLYDRLCAAREYLEENPDIKVIVSGGQGSGENITEAECMRRWLEDNGIAPERIIKEDKASSTAENAEFSMEIARSLTGRDGITAAVITSDYHLARSKLYFEKEGAQALGVSAKSSVPAALEAVYYIREIPAVIMSLFIKS